MQRAKFVFISNASLSISFCLIVSYFWQIKQTRYEKICIRTMSIMPMALHIGLCIYIYIKVVLYVLTVQLNSLCFCF